MFRLVLLCGVVSLVRGQNTDVQTPPLPSTQTPHFTVVTEGDEDSDNDITTEGLLPPSTGFSSPNIPDFITTADNVITTESDRAVTTEAPNPATERFTASGPSTQLPLELRQPTIKVHPRNVTVPKDSYAKFFCSATGSPSPHLVIVRADSNYDIPKFSKFSVSKTEESLPEVQQTIGPITEANEGWYECIAANYWGAVKSKAYLRVMDLCEGVECKEPKTCVQDYDAETASCQCPELLCAENFEPVCGADCKVHFNPCQWNQTSCTNDYDTTSIISTGQTCPPITDPEVVLVGDDAALDEGGRFSLSASVAGFPEPTVEWLKVDDDGNLLESLGKGKN